MKAFKISTSETNDFTECLAGDQSLILQAKKWEKVLNFHIRKCFKKIHVKKKKVQETVTSSLMEKRKHAIANKDEEEQNNVEEELQNMEANINMEKLSNNIQEIREKGNNGIWKLKNKFFSQKTSNAAYRKKKYLWPNNNKSKRTQKCVS